jgi:hypothetical protein
MVRQFTQVTLQGKTFKVPCATACGQTIVSTGKWLRVAAVRDEGVVEGNMVEDPARMVAELKGQRFSADYFTFAQKLPEADPKFRYQYELDNVAAIRLSTFDHWWKNQIKDKTRNMVRKAQKAGVQTRVVQLDDDFVRQVMEIYNETPVRQGRQFWHYGKDFATVRRELSTYLDRSTFIGSYLDGELIGFIKMVSVGCTVTLFHFLAKTTHRDKSPTNALIAKAVEVCISQGKQFLIYGKYQYGNKTKNPLTDFKRHNAFEQIDLPRYYIPLTLRGRIALKLGVHRGLLGMLPPSMVEFLWRIRASILAKKTPAKKAPALASKKPETKPCAPEQVTVGRG